MQMHPNEIDDDGTWKSDIHEGIELNLLGEKIPLPDNLKKESGDTHAEVLAVLNVIDVFTICPNCNSSPYGPVLMVEGGWYMYPAKCCDFMLWVKNKNEIPLDV